MVLVVVHLASFDVTECRGDIVHWTRRPVRICRRGGLHHEVLLPPIKTLWSQTVSGNRLPASLWPLSPRHSAEIIDGRGGEHLPMTYSSTTGGAMTRFSLNIAV